jgi:hypothetical protein
MRIGLLLLEIQLVLRPGLRTTMQWRNGWWSLVWYAGLALVSWQGIYSSDDEEHGQQNETRAQIAHTPTTEPAGLTGGD